MRRRPRIVDRAGAGALCTDGSIGAWDDMSGGIDGTGRGRRNSGCRFRPDILCDRLRLTKCYFWRSVAGRSRRIGLRTRHHAFAMTHFGSAPLHRVVFNRHVSRPVSRVLYGPRPFRRENVAAIHLGSGSPRTSRNLPGRRTGNSPEGRPSRRPYSVLLPVGFAVPLLLPVARWALTPPFHPYPAGIPVSPQKLRRSTGLQAGRSALCGAFPGVAPAGH